MAMGLNFTLILSNSGAPLLHDGEVVYLCKQATWISGAGTVTLSSHRLFFVDNSHASEIELQNIRRINVEPARLFSRAVRPLLVTLSSPEELTVEVTFKTQTDSGEFFSLLSRVLAQKNWGDAPPSLLAARPVGISGIIRHREREKQQTGKLAMNSFVDLDALMRHTRTIVVAMERCQTQVTAEANKAENARLHDIISQIGIRSPVTRSSAGLGYHEGLARELANFIKTGRHLERTGGILTLPDLYCLWNRARGMTLVSPDDLVQAAHLLGPLGLQISLRSFDTGVVVVQGMSHQDDLMGARLEAFAQEKIYVTPYQVAKLLDIPLPISRGHLKRAEEQGHLCRDECEYTGTINYYPNKLLDFYHHTPRILTGPTQN
mmetsp:Transcript_1422/g.2878  ORF Transcript_1422/g.2878 Transcript_1422/m.2878 type:complete len:377 (-) Transcript_1422:226-1356(-)